MNSAEHTLREIIELAPQTPAGERLRADARALQARRWRVLVSGLRSVGKSSVVATLWGDPQMLPTAVRDCTQTNTLIRAPHGGEDDRQVLLRFLPRAKCVQYALGTLPYYRLARFLAEVAPVRAKLEELPPEERLRQTLAAVRELFAARANLRVLHEELSDDLEELADLLAFLEGPEYQPDAPVPVDWRLRQEYLMGQRRPDGRILSPGRLRALQHVEVVHAPAPEAPVQAVTPLPWLLDTPWVPLLHETRRAELILNEALSVDVLVVVALPEAYHPEDWVLKALRARPELAARALVLFNQVDMIAPDALFAREGFAKVFEENTLRLRKIGILPQHVLLSCARLPFLEQLRPADAAVEERRSRLQAVLARLAKAGEKRAEGLFRERLLAACDPADAGLRTFSRQLGKLYHEAVVPAQWKALRAAFGAIAEFDLPGAVRERWAELKESFPR